MEINRKIRKRATVFRGYFYIQASESHRAYNGVPRRIDRIFENIP
jgi:hypothetical protein